MSDESDRDDAKVVPLTARRRGPCPMCGRPAVREHRPFCSARCAQLDLGRWLTGGYRIPTEETPDRDEPPEDQDGAGE